MVELFYRVLGAIGYHHPVHVVATHMPIGLVTGALVFGLIALLARKQEPVRCAYGILVLALVLAVPTAILGFMDWVHFYKGAWIAAIRAKIILAAVLLAILAAGTVLGRAGTASPKVMLAVYALAFATVVGLGFFGGNLVYGGAAGSASSGAAPALPQTAAPPADLQAGEAVFAASCSACHPKGGNVVDPGVPLKTSPTLASAEGFVAFIRNPKRADGKAGDMPAFDAKEIDDGKARQLYSYVLDAARRDAWR